MNNTVEIFDIDLGNDAQRRAFYDLNVEWLEKYFYVEEIDMQILSNPNKIVTENGFVFLAEYQGNIVGTVSLIRTDDGEFELSKLAVTEKSKGLGLGKALMEATLKRSKELGLKKIYIVSNRSLVPAITLYRKYGFVESEDNRHYQFERGDITMELDL